ncbi:MAG: hypothetical protein U0271_40480 [Polyangiaceae bacterium]
MAKDSVGPPPLDAAGRASNRRGAEEGAPPNRASLDALRPVRFDLSRGEILVSVGRSRVDDEPHVLLPTSVIASLLLDPGLARDAGLRVGVSAMERVATRMLSQRDERRGADIRQVVRAQPLEVVVDFLGAELAMLGLGALRIERWGKALLFVLDPCPLAAEQDAFVEGLFEGALASVAERDVRALVVDRTGETARVLVGSERAIDRAAPLVAEGQYFTDVIRTLHDRRSGARS